MKDKKSLLGYYNYTVVLTYMGMMVGFTGIACIIDGQYHQAILCLMIAGICDMFDGAIAATRERTKQEKWFGIQIDSLSDLICFGALPACFVYSISSKGNLGFFATGLYLLCALIRLSYFNVDEQERQETTPEPRKYYKGLPVTVAAIIIPAMYEFSFVLGYSMKRVGAITLIVMAFAFIIPFNLKKPAIIGKICVVLVGVAELLFLISGVDM